MASIYHYTSGSALLGIISDSEFWATDIRFLNDHDEHFLGSLMSPSVACGPVLLKTPLSI